MTTVVGGLWVRKSRWWFVVSAILFSVAAVPLGIGSWRNHVWEREVLRRDCMPPLPPHPDTDVLGQAGFGVVVIAMGFLLIGLILTLIGRHRWWTKVVAAVVIAVVLVLELWLVVLLLLVEDSPESTGEALPCHWLVG